MSWARLAGSMAMVVMIAASCTRTDLARTEDNRIALVIGNANYESGANLGEGPKLDAHHVREALKRLRFRVPEEKIDLGKHEMKKEIADFINRLHEDAIGVFYYSGHGMQLDNHSYLIPVNADIRGPESLREYGILADEIWTKMGLKGTHANIVILDACRNNPWFKSAPTGLAKPKEPEPLGSDTLVAYATVPGGVVRNEENDVSLFVKLLVKEITTPGATVHEAFENVRTNVSTITNRDQEPNNTEFGRFPSKLILATEPSDGPIEPRSVAPDIRIVPPPPPA